MDASRNKPCIEPVLAALQGCLARHVEPVDGLVVAFSGGLDSIALLHAASRMARAAGAEIRAVHVHHALSPNADSWADFCSRTAKGLGVPLEVRRIRVESGSGEGVEGAARRSRRAALLQDLPKWVLLGHHADDQAETLLLNLLRGSGVRGAAAMRERNGVFLRPLLTLSRQNLQAYARSHDLNWIEDESNGDVQYTRNYIRAAVIPVIRARFPSYASQFLAASTRFAEAAHLLEELARVDLGAHPPAFPVSVGLLTALPEPRARNVLRSLLFWAGVQSPDDRRLTEFVRQVRTAGRDRNPRIELPVFTLERRRGEVRLSFPG